jgi:hypothetical protein
MPASWRSPLVIEPNPGAGQDRVRVLIQPTKDAKGAPTITMSFEPPIHPH